MRKLHLRIKLNLERNFRLDLRPAVNRTLKSLTLFPLALLLAALSFRRTLSPLVLRPRQRLTFSLTLIRPLTLTNSRTIASRTTLSSATWAALLKTQTTPWATHHNQSRILRTNSEATCPPMPST